jgi:hypothetical protein
MLIAMEINSKRYARMLFRAISSLDIFKTLTRKYLEAQTHQEKNEATALEYRKGEKKQQKKHFI